MPPRINSRYLSTEGVVDDNGYFHLTEREPFKYDANLPGTIRHRVGAGESIFTIAFKYYDPFPNAEHLWWVLCEFQPDPILDPTLDLAENRIIFVPTLRVIQEKVLGV